MSVAFYGIEIEILFAIDFDLDDDFDLERVW